MGDALIVQPYTPCKTCPFRLHGGIILTRERAEELVETFYSDGHFYCHETVDYDEEDEDGEPTPAATHDSGFCAGSLVLQLRDMERIGQLPRIAQRMRILDMDKIIAAADDPKNGCDVFDSYDEFVEEHDGGNRLTGEEERHGKEKHGKEKDECEDHQGNKAD